jgi:hypothetical protein
MTQKNLCRNPAVTGWSRDAKRSSRMRKSPIYWLSGVIILVHSAVHFGFHAQLGGDQRGWPNSNFPIEMERYPIRPAKILMATYVFGEDAINKRYLRMFVESARLAGVNFAIVGHPVPAFPLPPNVRHVHITWNSLVDRVRDRIFEGREPSSLRAAQPYKIIDFKPVFGYLFPEQMEGFDWWGHLDNDMVVGNLRQYLTPDLLDQNDILCGIDSELTWGPFTMYRNTKTINELFLKSPRSLRHIFNSTKPQFFDEWGHNGSGVRSKKGTRRFNSSMSGIIENYGAQLGLRWQGGVVPSDWDKRCATHDQLQPRCGECVLTRLPGRSQQRLVATTTGCKEQDGAWNCAGEEVGLCHYIYAKKDSLEPSLVDDRKMDRLIAEGQFRVSWESGFSVLDENGGDS